jgi:hypothetical protein
MNPYIQCIRHVHEAAQSNKIKRNDEDVILRSILGSAPSTDMGSLIGTLVQTYGTQDQGRRIASILIGDTVAKKSPGSPPRTPPQRRGRPPKSPPPLQRKRQARSSSSDDSPPASPPPKKRKDYWNQKERNILIKLVNDSIEKHNEIRWKPILSKFSPRRTEQAVRNKYLALIKENVIAPLMEEDNRQTEDRSGVSDTTQTLPENTDQNTTTPGARG